MIENDSGVIFRRAGDVVVGYFLVGTGDLIELIATPNAMKRHPMLPDGGDKTVPYIYRRIKPEPVYRV